MCLTLDISFEKVKDLEKNEVQTIKKTFTKMRLKSAFSFGGNGFDDGMVRSGTVLSSNVVDERSKKRSTEGRKTVRKDWLFC